MKKNQFKTNSRKSITSLKIGRSNNTQNKNQMNTPTHTHRKSMYMRNPANSLKIYRFLSKNIKG